MKKQYASIQSVENTGKRTSAGTTYVQVVTEDDSVFFFTENDMKKAKLRAEKNVEDQVPRSVKFELKTATLTKPQTMKATKAGNADVSFGQAIGKLPNPWKW